MESLFESVAKPMSYGPTISFCSIVKDNSLSETKNKKKVTTNVGAAD